MNYGKLGSAAPPMFGASSPSENAMSSPALTFPKRIKLLLFSLLATSLLIACAVSASVFIATRTHTANSSRSEPTVRRTPTKAISKTCENTRFKQLCLNSLLDFPGSQSASEPDLVHMSFKVTLQKFGRALYKSSEISNVEMDTRVRSAYEDCLELLEDSVDALSRSLHTVSTSASGATQDVLTWLSAALTNHDTCTDGFTEVNGYVKDQMVDKLRDLSELVSNCLAIYAASDGDDFSGVPIGNKRRRLLGDEIVDEIVDENIGYPRWMSRKDRRLLDLTVATIEPQADIIVSQAGNGTCKTIAEAIKKVPENSTRRTIIYIKAGRYEEKTLKVGRKKKNLMFIGDGKGKTVISGGNSIFNNMTTFHTATFAATGAGFIARDITFENWAGPAKHQAVALRVGADHAVIYRCNIIGYQDTLYVHSQRQFFRECDIYGTVDFIFGNAAVVFQNCSIYARKPMDNQKNTITAQNRKDPNQNTGISIHACRIMAAPDLAPSKANISTYLGRPWKLYSRTVFMLSYIGDHVHPRGWLEWNATFALDTLYYGEYMNYGPGGAVGQRVKWPGYRVITSPAEAGKFTVSQFIYGSSWLPSTGVAFLAGLSV